MYIYIYIVNDALRDSIIFIVDTLYCNGDLTFIRLFVYARVVKYNLGNSSLPPKIIGAFWEMNLFSLIFSWCSLPFICWKCITYIHIYIFFHWTLRVYFKQQVVMLNYLRILSFSTMMHSNTRSHAHTKRAHGETRKSMILQGFFSDEYMQIIYTYICMVVNNMCILSMYVLNMDL